MGVTKLFKKFLICVVALSLILAFSSDLEAAEDTLIIASPAEATGLDPRLETDVHSQERMYTILEPLITFDTDMNIIPRLATDWGFSEDGLTLSFELREGVHWHDGEPFTAEDVKYTYNWVLNPDHAAPNRELYATIEEIEIEDPHTVNFHLSEEDSFLLNNLARIPVVPAHDGDREDFRSSPIGTGPYEFESWDRDDVMILKANEDYWGGNPNFEYVEFRPIEEDSARQMALEAGDVHASQGDVVPEDIDRLEEDPNLKIQRATGTGYTYLAYNTRKEIFEDVEMRRAISHLVPKEAIVERIMHNIGQVATTSIPSGLPWHNPDVPTYDYNPEKAQEIIDDLDIDLEDLTLTLHTNENPQRIRIAEIIQAEAANIGIDVEVNIEEWGAFWSNVQQPDHGYDLFVVGWVGQVDPDRAMYRQFHSEGGMNFGGYAHPRLDELLDKGRTVPPDSEESIELYYEAQQIEAEEEFYTQIFYYEEVGASDPSLEGYSPHPHVSMAWQDIHTFELLD